jgi:hypothetical protein
VDGTKQQQGRKHATAAEQGRCIPPQHSKQPVTQGCGLPAVIRAHTNQIKTGCSICQSVPRSGSQHLFALFLSLLWFHMEGHCPGPVCSL